MAFEASKKEWSELYAFFRLLSDGKVSMGTPDSKKGESEWLISYIQREEHDGTRQYFIEDENIRIISEKEEKLFPRDDFNAVANLVLNAIKTATDNEVTSPEGVEEFLDEVGIFDLESKTEGRTDFSIDF